MLGHVCISEFYYSELSDGIRRFCYMFHLPLFFFCAGYLYRRIGLRKKIVKIIRSYYFPFIVIGLISIGCYPIWRALGITESETLMQLAKRVLGVFAFRIDGFFIQPMWFLCFFAVCQLEYWAFDALIERQKYVLRLLVAFVIGIVGMDLVHFFGKGIFYEFLSLTMIPLIEIGGVSQVNRLPYLCADNWSIQKKMPLVCIGCFTMMAALILFTDKEIELSKCSFFGGIWFYPVILVGISFCVSVSMMVMGNKHMPGIYNILRLAGKYSFWIMCFHVSVFKIIDGIAGLLYHCDLKVLQRLLWSFPMLRCVYFAAGLIIPSLIGMGIEIWSRKRRLKRNEC